MTNPPHSWVGRKWEMPTCEYCGVRQHMESSQWPCVGKRIRNRYPHKPVLTRHEQLELAADNGVDTWEDYRGEN